VFDKLKATLSTIESGEAGHAQPFAGILISGAGLVMLGIGAANDTGWLAVAGGVVAAVGNAAWDVIRHMTIDYDVYGRLEKLEKK
jgi:hypothetical protein